MRAGNLPVVDFGRRSTGNVSFSEDEVHLLPGFPSDVDPNGIEVAFFVRFPAGIATDTVGVVEKSTLLKIVQTSQQEIEKTMNKTISNLEVYYVVGTSPTPTLPTPGSPSSNNTLYYIVGGVLGGALLIALVALLYW